MNVYITDKDLKNLYVTGTSKKFKLRREGFQVIMVIKYFNYGSYK